jgi:hypothetical protein
VGIVLAGDDMPSNALDNEKGYDKPDYKEYARIDHYMQEVAVVFWGMTVRGGMARFAHLR